MELGVQLDFTFLMMLLLRYLCVVLVQFSYPFMYNILLIPFQNFIFAKF